MSSETREQMIETGARLFRRQGFHATTLVQVVEEGGLPRGSIYHHFPGGKPQLAREAVAHAAREVEADMVQAMAGSRSLDDAIARYVHRLADRLEQSGFVDGCWYAAMALDVAPDDAELADLLSAQFTRWQKSISAGLVRYGLPRKRAAAAAELLVASIEGGLLLARVHRDARALRRLIPALQRAVAVPE